MRMTIIAGAALLALPFAASTVTAQEAAQEAAPAASQAAPDAKSAVADKVKADWAKYDKGNKGHLTKAELGSWLTDLRTSAGQPAPDAEWQNSAFTQTDTNSDKKISEEELAVFLNSGA